MMRRGDDHISLHNTTTDRFHDATREGSRSGDTDDPNENAAEDLVSAAFWDSRRAPYSDLSIFQKIGVAGPSSTPESDLRQPLGSRYWPSGM
jgi:hypothetical protein